MTGSSTIFILDFIPEVARTRKQPNYEAAWQIRDRIRHAYTIHQEIMPNIEFDVEERQIYAHHYAGDRDCLSERWKMLLDSEHREAEAHRQIMIFR